MMIYDSLQAQFLRTKQKGHIQRYETPIFGNIVVYVCTPINDDNQTLWRLYNIVRFDMASVHLTSQAGPF